MGADDEGEEIGLVRGSWHDCEKACNRDGSCKSFAFCDDRCYLKAKDIAMDAPSHHNTRCSTFRNDPSAEPWTGEGDVWELIGSSNISEELSGTYMTNQDHIPKCMQGLVWMDEECTTRAKLPEDYTCRRMASVNEYTTGFKWWDWGSRCFAFGRDSWTFGDASIYDYVCHYGDVVFCQTNHDTHDDPCGEGAYFQLHGSSYAMIRSSFGWDRLTEQLFHYPLLQVIDWQGQQTKWFKDYWTAVSRIDYPPNLPWCNLNKWASVGKVARCLHAIAR